MFQMRNTVFISLAFWAGVNVASPYCEPVSTDSAERWPIPEEAFTKENAIAASKRLVEILENDLYKESPVGIECEFKNQTIIIDGYALKEAIADYPEEYLQNGIDRFCQFLHEEAIVCH